LQIKLRRQHHAISMLFANRHVLQGLESGWSILLQAVSTGHPAPSLKSSWRVPRQAV
jgi:hypothetical protein